MTILTRAWNKVTPETIKNCFKKAGICSEAQTIAINDLDNPFAVLSEEIQSLREAYPEAVPANVKGTLSPIFSITLKSRKSYSC